MTWRRGFRRLWAVLSLVWLVLAVAFLATRDLGYFLGHVSPPVVLGFLFGPPIVVYVLGAVLAWVLSGFTSGSVPRPIGR